MEADSDKKFRRELHSGAVSLVVLSLVKTAGREMYGYELAKEVERHSRADAPVRAGTIYPVLRSLERQGLLTSRIGPSDSGPPRRYYRLTAKGAAALSRWRGAWQETVDFVNMALRSRR
jgi:PadR family transcriptional regulator PadR